MRKHIFQQDIHMFFKEKLRRDNCIISELYSVHLIILSFLDISSSSILVFSLAFDQHSKNFLLLCLKDCTSVMVSGNKDPKVSGSNKDNSPPRIELLPKMSIGK